MAICLLVYLNSIFSHSTNGIYWCDVMCAIGQSCRLKCLVFAHYAAANNTISTAICTLMTWLYYKIYVCTYLLVVLCLFIQAKTMAHSDWFLSSSIYVTFTFAGYNASVFNVASLLWLSVVWCIFVVKAAQGWVQCAMKCLASSSSFE